MELLKDRKTGKFLALGFFVVLVVAGLSFAFWLSGRSEGDRSGQSIELTAPTVVEYQAEVGPVIRPFLERVSSLEEGNLTDEVRDSLLLLGATTQERLLRMRVPGSEREAHLSFVTLIDRWRVTTEPEAVGGDWVELQEQATDLLVRYPWLDDQNTYYEE